MIPFVLFSIRRAWQGFWRNGLMSIAATATMTFMLLLLGGFWIVQAGLSAGLQYVEQKVQVVAYMKEDATQAQADEAVAAVRQMPEVQDVVYVSKDEALARFRSNLAERGQPDLTGSLDTNPLPASIEVYLVDPTDFGAIVTQLESSAGVDRVDDVQQLVDRVTTVTTVIRTVGIVALVLVGLTVLFIIVNTIRLAVTSRAEEIEIMRLVGASDAFIRWPFIFEGALVGVLGALVTLVILGAAAAPLSSLMLGFFRVLPLEFGTLVRDVAVLVLVTGLGLGVVGSYVSVRSYLIR
ncbi:MAG: permease-like cell division protein FtsX [Chloroflexi bacterium]|nr:permease-like cell division protein FtsX [Chloroflexota bacterium]